MKPKYSKNINYCSILGGLILILIGISCNSNPSNKADKQTISKSDIESYISKGQLNKLFNNTDTLNFSINLSGSIYRRIDLVTFFKKQDTIYVIPEIRVIFDSDTIISAKKKYIKLSDRQDFERLLIKIHKLQAKKIDNTNKVKISIGVLNKWGFNYSFDRDSQNFIEIKDYYLNIMNIIYPEIEEYKTYGAVEIVDDQDK